MRIVAWIGLVLACALVAPLVGAEELTPTQAADKVIEALKADATPKLVAAIDAKDASIAALEKALASDPEQLLRVVTAQLEHVEALARRDTDKAPVIAEWLVGVAMAARKAKSDSLPAIQAQSRALLGRGKLGVALVEKTKASCWTKAADYLAETAEHKQAEDAIDASWVKALEILHDAAGSDGVPSASLMDHAHVICGNALRSRGDSEVVRRAVVASYKGQSEAHFEKSRKKAQDALIRYFEAFRPLADVKSRSKQAREDALRWNAMITFARQEKIKVKEEYLATPGHSSTKLAQWLLPNTGRWTFQGDRIHEAFPGGKLFRIISFEPHSWQTLYSYGGGKSVGGDNMKGVAGLDFNRFVDTAKDEGVKVQKAKKPGRGKLNKAMGSGIQWSLERIDSEGEGTRVRAFYVRANKAQRTLRVMVTESIELTAHDPEFEAVLDSIEIVPSQR